MVGTGSMTDPYCHVEESIQYTRKCLEVILKHHCGATLITKSDRVLRDLDLLDKINKDSKAVLQITLTTADYELCKKVEPNVSVTSKRVEVLKQCKALGIPTVVWLCPFLPFINDTEDNINRLMDMCIENDVKGVIFFGVGLTLRDGNREYFYEHLDKDFPGLKEKYIKTYGNRYQITSPKNAALSKIFINRCKEHGIMCNPDEVFKYLHEYPEKFEQLSLF